MNQHSDHLDPVRSKLRAAPVAQPPHPWRSLPTYAVGGLQFVGFDRAGRHLLVVSSTGRGLFDCSTGARVARDLDDDGTWLDEAHLECMGIGPIADEIVPMAGLGGGGLRRSGADGWSLETVTLDWPDTRMVLLPSYRSLYEPDAPFTVVACEREVRAAGFAPSERTLVVATSSDFCWWSL